ncbi:MAG: tRNA (adenosine(37)-N6)-threonylcarbamoyltransferase complex dimerization subunit type 1 TsaB [Patescibacteria group bacterium]
MIILGIRTDKPEAELYLYDDKKELGKLKWQAHRELSKTIHSKIQEILNKLSISWDDIEGIVCFKGPGSFTGLRIGLTVANALAYAQNIPIVARRGENWLEAGLKDLQTGKTDKIATPYYDRPAATSPPKK